MNAYAVVESIVVTVLVLISVLIVLNAFIPGPVRRIRARVADLLSRTTQGNPLNSLAARLRDDDSSGGCATGCQSGCNGCGIAARARLLPVREDAPNRH